MQSDDQPSGAAESGGETGQDRQPAASRGAGDQPQAQPLVVVSNRLPIRLEVTPKGWRSHASSGGLATAMAGVVKGGPDGPGRQMTWVGWPGADVAPEHQEEVRRTLAAQRLAPVFLTAEQEHLYYRDFSNAVLWPLLHYFSHLVDYRPDAWQGYQKVNELFAEQVAATAPEGAQVWVHDFHLMLLPQLLRERRDDLEIGFFLHIPFPSSEIYRQMPQREEILRGVLGSDYISFHTGDYARHFQSTCTRVLGLESEPSHIAFEGRRVGVGVDPIGIDTQHFADVLGNPRTHRLSGQLVDRYEGRRLLLGIERLDYTKGVLHKLEGFARYLERDPKRVHDTVLLQILVPSRLNHPEYQQLKREIEESIGRINGAFGLPGRQPIEYMHRSLDPEELVSLYRSAKAALVTPVRDGMNLIAQEFVLCQALPAEGMRQAQGSLILSEFAGAARSLPHAQLVNPWDRHDIADAIEDALAMPEVERRRRMDGMVGLVRHLDSSLWAQRYLSKLNRSAAAERDQDKCRILDDPSRAQVLERCIKADRRLLLLDYDGTLQELQTTPEMAEPSQELRGLLTALASRPSTEVHVVSGRPRVVLEEWLGDLPIHLSCEHGFVTRRPGSNWQEVAKLDRSWMPHIARILEENAREVPGAFVETKPSALAWHYRQADGEYGSWRARELLTLLEGELSGIPAEVIHGHKVLEVRAAGIHKGRYVQDLTQDQPRSAFILCIGDDRTDEDMYAALPEHAISMHVGDSSDDAGWRLRDPEAVRELLRDINANLETDTASCAG